MGQVVGPKVSKLQSRGSRTDVSVVIGSGPPCISHGVRSCKEGVQSNPIFGGLMITMGQLTAYPNWEPILQVHRPTKEQTPKKPEYLIDRKKNLTVRGPLGFGPINFFLMDKTDLQKEKGCFLLINVIVFSVKCQGTISDVYIARRISLMQEVSDAQSRNTSDSVLLS